MTVNHFGKMLEKSVKIWKEKQRTVRKWGGGVMFAIAMLHFSASELESKASEREKVGIGYIAVDAADLTKTEKRNVITEDIANNTATADGTYILVYEKVKVKGKKKKIRKGGTKREKAIVFLHPTGGLAVLTKQEARKARRGVIRGKSPFFWHIGLPENEERKTELREIRSRFLEYEKDARLKKMKIKSFVYKGYFKSEELRPGTRLAVLVKKYHEERKKEETGKRGEKKREEEVKKEETEKSDRIGGGQTGGGQIGGGQIGGGQIGGDRIGGAPSQKDPFEDREEMVRRFREKIQGHIEKRKAFEARREGFQGIFSPKRAEELNREAEGLNRELNALKEEYRTAEEGVKKSLPSAFLSEKEIPITKVTDEDDNGKKDADEIRDVEERIVKVKKRFDAYRKKIESFGGKIPEKERGKLREERKTYEEEREKALRARDGLSESLRNRVKTELPEELPELEITRESDFDFAAHGKAYLYRKDGRETDLSADATASEHVLKMGSPYVTEEEFAVDGIEKTPSGYLVIIEAYGIRLPVDQKGKAAAEGTRDTDVLLHNLHILAPFYGKEKLSEYRDTKDLPEILKNRKILRVHFLKEDVILSADYETANKITLVFENADSLELSLGAAGKEIGDFLIFETETAKLPVMIRKKGEETETLLDRLDEAYAQVKYRNSAFKNGDYQEFFLEEAFRKVKENRRHWLKVLLHNSAETYDTEVLYERLVREKEKVLMSMAYLSRWYDFEIGRMNPARDLWFNLSPGEDALLFLLRLTKEGGGLSSAENAFTYTSVFKPLTKQNSMRDFLHFERQVWLPSESTNEWFLRTTKAYVSEQPPESIGVPLETFERLNVREFEKMYLPLLTLSKRSVYLIPTQATLTLGSIETYVSDLDNEREMRAFYEIADKNARYQRDHIDFWYRISSNKVKDRLIHNTVKVRDAHLRGGDNWDENTMAVKEFFAPVGEFHRRVPTVDALSDDKDITFYRKLLDKKGFENGSIWTHELVHALEDSIYLDGFGVRPTVGQENYAEGLLQSLRGTTKDAIGWNSFVTLTEADREFQHVNSAPTRFQDAQALQTYMKRLLDVIYVLDYAEAEAIAKLGADDKMRLLRKLQLFKDRRENDGTLNSAEDWITEIDRAEAERLRSWEDFVDLNVIVNRHPFNSNVGLRGGTRIGRNAYHKIPLYVPMFGLAENDTGASGGYTFRRTAFELLAYKGYAEGMVPYISNRYQAEATHSGQPLSDSYIVKKIFENDSFRDLKSFKKAMFRERIERLNTLRPLDGGGLTVSTKEDLLTLFEAAYREDVRSSESHQVFRLRKKLYEAYFALTDEFREEIFR